MRNYFTFGEFDSRDFGVFITRDGVYNAPKRAYRQVQIPGRNGDLMIDEGRLENINVTYPALIYSSFDSNIEGLRNALLSQNGYVRITDSYHPDEYRLGCFSEELSVLPQVLGDGGTFDVTFNCKPQRFLVSGEQSVAVASGDTITNPTLLSSKPLIEVAFDTDARNMVPLPYYTTSPYTYNGLTFTVSGREITVNGTATARAWYSIVWHGSIPEGTYHLSGVPDASGVEIDCWFQRRSDSVQLANFVATSDGIDFTITQELADAYWNLQVYVASGTTLVNEIITPVIKASGSQSVLFVGDSRIVLTNNYPSISIDSEIQDCYYGTANANPSVEFTNDDFPELPPGETGVTFGGGISNVKITPRWYIV